MDAIKEYNKIMGISPTHTQTQFIQNIYNDNRNLSCSPEMMQIIGEHIRSLGQNKDKPMLIDTLRPQDVVLEGEVVDNE